jgi:nitrate reductase gamma subunit
VFCALIVILIPGARSPAQLLRRKQLIIGSILFHLGILVVLGGHAVGLLTPIAGIRCAWHFSWCKQILAITAGGIAGVFLFYWSLPSIAQTSIRCPYS